MASTEGMSPIDQVRHAVASLLLRPRLIQAVAAVTGAYALYYLLWRTTATLNPLALGFSLLFLFAEAQGVVNYLLFAFMAWDVRQNPPPIPSPNLRVDVYVPTYNEGRDVLEPTLLGCQAITYPHTTYVLDDGRRPEIEELAKSLGCRYLTRPDNRHAKAGNLNAALPRTQGEFIAVFDADTVPQPDFLDRTLGHFADDRVAVVQLPQEFYNLDSVQHSGRRSDGWHEQALFYRVIQLGKNRWNAAFWCGSPSVVRRSALESVGGVATSTVTEDIHTSIRLHARGWKTVYHNEPVAFGIAPPSLEAFTVQRLRWAQGSMQVLRSRENPLVARGLSLAQRLNYLASMLTYFDAYQKLIFLLTPAAVLLTGILPLRVDVWDYVAHWLPYFALGLLANLALGRGTFSVLDVERYNLLKVFTFIRASIKLIWPRGVGFKVTPKQARSRALNQDLRQVIPQLAVLGVLGLSVVIGLANLLWPLTASYATEDVFVIALFWTLANSGLLGLGIGVVLRRRYRRRNYRFQARVLGSLEWGDGWKARVFAADLSVGGVGLLARADLTMGERVDLTLDLPDGPLSLVGTVAHVGRRMDDGRRKVGVSLAPLSDFNRERWIRFLFVTLARCQHTMGALPSGSLPLAPNKPQVVAEAFPFLEVVPSHGEALWV